MKRCSRHVLFLAALFLLGLPQLAFSSTYTFSSWDNSGTQNDLSDLDHNYLHLWGIDWKLPQGETISGASIHFSNIYDWQRETDILKVYLLDNVRLNDVPGSVDLITIPDNQQTSPANEIPYYDGTRFSDYARIWSWSDPDLRVGQVDPATGAKRTSSGFTFDYAFDGGEISLLTTYLSTPNLWGKTSNVGIGFDPDCHYYNGGITWTINTTTATVPEPTTIILLGAGLVALGLRRRMLR
jgi:hypothetical protein